MPGSAKVVGWGSRRKCETTTAAPFTLPTLPAYTALQGCPAAVSDDRGIGENSGKYGKTRKTSFFFAVLGSGRHPRGFLDPVGFTPVEYEPERSHLDLIQLIFHDFPPNLAFCCVHNPYICCIHIVYLLYRDNTVSLCGTHTGQVCGAAAAVREYSGATPSPPSTHPHTPDIATLRCRGIRNY